MIAAPRRRTTTDEVFERLHSRIMSLDLMPGTRMSEAEVALEFGVSRQPVRDAFNRLASMGLLFIQPQKATRVQGFSRSAIDTARFVRLALEIEIARDAARNWTSDAAPRFEAVLRQQAEAVNAANIAAFHASDLDFHALLADIAGRPGAFETVKAMKAQIDRLCVLSLKAPQEMADLVRDHRDIYDAIARQDTGQAEKLLRIHLSRIQKTIDEVHRNHADCFLE